jgi:hypothetical protein
VAGFIVEKECKDTSFASVVSLLISVGGTGIEWKMSTFLCLLCSFGRKLKGPTVNKTPEALLQRFRTRGGGV